MRQGSPPSPQPVSVRAVFLGLLGVAVLCAWTPYNNYKVAATLLGGNQFPVFALFVLLLLAFPVNTALRRFAPRTAFRPGEMLTIWTMLLVASGIPSSGMMRTFIPSIAAPSFYSDDRNQWETRVWGPLPGWLKMHDTDAAKAFFAGYPRGQEHVPWQAWIAPLFFWGIFALFFLTASFCVAGLLRRQWIENEKFAFPLVTLPLLLAEEPEAGHQVNRLLRSPLLWIAFILTTTLHTLKGFHLLYPTVPDIMLNWNLQDFLTVPPWSQIGRFEASIYPLVIGISYLLSSEVCFSLWFFFLFYKAEILLCAAYNWDMPASLGGFSQKLFHSLEAFGGCVALTGWTLWAARAHLRTVFDAATQPGPSKPEEANEMLSYRALFWLLLASYAGIGVWESVAGIPGVLILVSLVMITLALVVIGWVVCQAGMLFMAMPYATIDVLAPTVGTGPFSVPALYTQYRAEVIFIYNTRELLLPGLLNGLKAADGTKTPLRPFLGAMVAAVIVAITVSAVASLQLPYHNGGGNTLANSWTYREGPLIPLQLFGNAARIPYPGAWVNYLHMAGGFAGVLGLLFARTQWGFALHPIGFLGASTHAVHSIWFSIFLGWLCKRLIERYGGMRGFVGLLPFFLGLVLGDVVSAMLWIGLGNLTGVGYNNLPT